MFHSFYICRSPVNLDLNMGMMKKLTYSAVSFLWKSTIGVSSKIGSKDSSLPVGAGESPYISPWGRLVTSNIDVRNACIHVLNLIQTMQSLN